MVLFEYLLSFLFYIISGVSAKANHISNDEHEQYLAEMRELYIMDQKAIEEYGYDKGLEQGLEQVKQEKIKIAKKLKEREIPINIIVETTGLTPEEIEKI